MITPDESWQNKMPDRPKWQFREFCNGVDAGDYVNAHAKDEYLSGNAVFRGPLRVRSGQLMFDSPEELWKSIGSGRIDSVMVGCDVIYATGVSLLEVAEVAKLVAENEVGYSPPVFDALQSVIDEISADLSCGLTMVEPDAVLLGFFGEISDSEFGRIVAKIRRINARLRMPAEDLCDHGEADLSKRSVLLGFG